MCASKCLVFPLAKARASVATTRADDRRTTSALAQLTVRLSRGSSDSRGQSMQPPVKAGNAAQQERGSENLPVVVKVLPTEKPKNEFDREVEERESDRQFVKLTGGLAKYTESARVHRSKSSRQAICSVGGSVLADGDCEKLITLFLRDCCIVPWYVRAQSESRSLIGSPTPESWFGSFRALHSFAATRYELKQLSP